VLPSLILQDIDAKFENQDRMINFLIQQVQSIEMSLKSNTRQSQGGVDIDREEILRLKTDLR
jgi:hypothetical protein